MNDVWEKTIKKNKLKVMNELIFCSELMKRITKTVEDNTDWKKTQVRNDIIRLRRELNNVREFMDECNRKGDLW